MSDLDEILRRAMERKASDVNIQVGLPPMVRIQTRLVPLDSDELSAEAAERLIFSIMPEAQKNALREHREFDLSYGLAGVGRFRINGVHPA
jgi:twitching motility protein PilT